MANTPNLDLVKPAGTDKALVSVINSNSDKIDGGYGTLSEQIANKFTTISSGSLKNIKTPGAYYLTAAVTDKPYSGGGSYILSVANNNSNYLAGIYIPYDGSEPWQVTCSNGTWSSQKLETAGDVNNRFNNKVSYTTAFDITLKSGTSCHYYLDRVGRSIYGDVVFIADSAVPANTVVAHATGVSNVLDVHVSSLGSSSGFGRFRFTPSGNIICENALPANEWFSFSFVALYNTGV